jgi:hypothetical protein
MAMVCSHCGGFHMFMFTITYPRRESVRMWSPEKKNYIAVIARPGGSIVLCLPCWKHIPSEPRKHERKDKTIQGKLKLDTPDAILHSGNTN